MLLRIVLVIFVLVHYIDGRTKRDDDFSISESKMSVLEVINLLDKLKDQINDKEEEHYKSEHSRGLDYDYFQTLFKSRKDDYNDVTTNDDREQDSSDTYYISNPELLIDYKKVIKEITPLRKLIHFLSDFRRNADGREKNRKSSENHLFRETSFGTNIEVENPGKLYGKYIPLNIQSQGKKDLTVKKKFETLEVFHKDDKLGHDFKKPDANSDRRPEKYDFTPKKLHLANKFTAKQNWIRNKGKEWNNLPPKKDPYNSYRGPEREYRFKQKNNYNNYNKNNNFKRPKFNNAGRGGGGGFGFGRTPPAFQGSKHVYEDEKRKK